MQQSHACDGCRGGARRCVGFVRRIGKMPHIVCVSGTFSPPHRGHVLMAIESARSLRKLGKNVAAVCFVPVHDNYLRNKVSADAKEDIAFSSSQRVLMLKELIAQEQSNDVKCIVLDWECENKHLLTESPGYWAKKLPGYLKTIPTKKLLPAFQSTWIQKHFGKDAKAAWVFGMDNLEYMPSWNNVDSIFRSSDLILVCRKSNLDVVTLRSDPKRLLSSFNTVHVSTKASLEVRYNHKVVFGHEAETKIGNGTSEIFVLEKLTGDVVLCASSKLRRAMRTIRLHGYLSSERALTTLLHHKDRSWATIRSDEEDFVVVSKSRSVAEKESEWNFSRVNAAIMTCMFFMLISTRNI